MFPSTRKTLTLGTKGRGTKSPDIVTHLQPNHPTTTHKRNQSIPQNTMLRLTLHAKTASPIFINQRLFSRKYTTKPTPNGTGQSEKPKDTPNGTGQSEKPNDTPNGTGQSEKPKDTPSENAKMEPNTGRGGESNLWVSLSTVLT